MYWDIDVATGIGTDGEIGSVPDTDTDTCRCTCTHMYMYTYTYMNRYFSQAPCILRISSADFGRSELILFRRCSFLSLVDSRFTVHCFFFHISQKIWVPLQAPDFAHVHLHACTALQ